MKMQSEISTLAKFKSVDKTKLAKDNMEKKYIAGIVITSSASSFLGIFFTTSGG